MHGNLRLYKPAIKFWACARGLRHVDLARHLDVTESQLSRAINNYHGVSERVALALAQKLGVTVDDIVAPLAARRVAMGAA